MQINEGKNFQMLPPPRGACQICATEHEECLPHNRNSLYYQFWFHAQYGRSPTWADAMLHCPAEIQEVWTEKLKEFGIEVEGDRNANY